jgi:hypothetical protein
MMWLGNSASASTPIYAWKPKYGGMEVSEAEEVKHLRNENARLKKLVAELSLDKNLLQSVIRKKLPGLEALACENALDAVERELLRKFAGGDVGQQTGSGHALFDCHLRLGGGFHPRVVAIVLACKAGILLARMVQTFKVAGIIFDLPALVGTDLLALQTTAGTRAPFGALRVCSWARYFSPSRSARGLHHGYKRIAVIGELNIQRRHTLYITISGARGFSSLASCVEER